MNVFSHTSFPRKGLLHMILVLFAMFPSLTLAASWQMIPEQSRIEFSGTHAANAFKGNFSRFDAAIDFDTEKLDQSKVTVNVDLSSAKTGDATYDGTLPEGDWLNSKKTTTATFATTTITQKENVYIAKGTLTLREKSAPVTLPFTLTEQPDGATLMEGKTTLNRMDFDIGKESDASGEWVSLEIPLHITLVAKPR